MSGDRRIVLTGRVWEGTMRFTVLCVALVALCASEIARAQGAVVHNGVEVRWIQSGDPGRECFFFTLAGIQEVHPDFPGQPWLSVPSSSPRAKEILSSILLSRTVGIPMDVQTRGVNQCGIPEAEWVRLK